MLLLIGIAWPVSAFGRAANVSMNVGAGLHYLHNVGDFGGVKGVDFDKNSVSLMASFQHSGILTLEGDVEYVFDYSGSGHAMWAPQVFILTRGLIYGGAGIGVGYIDGGFMDDPFYALRAGVNVPVGGVHLDAFATYRFQSPGRLKGWDSLDSATLAALLRFDF